MLRFHGESSLRPFVGFIFHEGWPRWSWESSWLWIRTPKPWRSICMPSTNCVVMPLTWLTQMLKELLVSRENWIKKWWSLWVPTPTQDSMTLSVIAWSKKRTITPVPQPRVAREH
jgi:hypothetical protein